jgi:redox-sensitive bicupin YhaK (pirin superfamily)
MGADEGGKQCARPRPLIGDEILTWLLIGYR